MIERIIRFCAANRLLVILGFAGAALWAVHVLGRVPLDALPDLSDTQVIVTTRWDRSPDIIEDQVTYPIVSALLGAPNVKAVRGLSDFGFSFVYVVFQDGTDLYWARSRVLESLSKIEGSLPEGVKTELGPDATGVGWVFQYALVDRTTRHSLAELRSFQDWVLRPALRSVPGVSDVASIGGYEKQYQVTVDPARLQGYGLSVLDVSEAIRKSNSEVGARLLEFSGAEYMVRGRGYVEKPADLESVVLKSNDRGVPVLLRDVGWVDVGPQIRRGIADLNGNGDAVGGIVIMRHGENALQVIERVKARLEGMKGSLPDGVEVVTTYDRSDLIQRSIGNLKHALWLELLIVSAAILFFLWHPPSAFVPIVTIPLAVLLAFIPMWLFGISSNVMSLAGIAICIGVLVDGAIVEVENAYKKLETWRAGGGQGNYQEIRLQAMLEVAPSVFFSLLVVAVSFLPVFALVDQEGRMFRPLAITKTLTMAVAALLAITLDPAVRLLFTRMEPFRFRPRFLARVASALAVGTYRPEESHPVSRVLFRLYEKPCRFVLRHPRSVIAAAFLVVLVSVPAYLGLGREFMPPFEEGSILYMPTTLPGISVTEANRLLGMQDRILKSFPEVDTVFGKAGRAETSTDPAPLSMMETTVLLKPEKEWRQKPRWYSSWAPGPLRSVLRTAWPDRISREELVDEMDRALKIPGTTNAWTMPIRGRIDMLSTGVRTPVGIKVLGADLKQIEPVATRIEEVLKKVPGTRSAFAERAAAGRFVDLTPDREALARFGLTVEDVQSVVLAAIGGETVSTAVDGRARTTINVRYPRDLRSDLDQLERVLVPTKRGVQVPLRDVAAVAIRTGPSMLRDENGMLAAYVFADVSGRDIGSYVDEAQRAVEKEVALPTGTSLLWSGQYESILRVRERLRVIVPVTIALILALLYLNTKSFVKAMIVFLAVPFSLVGAVWLLYALGYNVSIATWVGMIALLGLDAETGVFMLLFLDLSHEDARKRGLLRNVFDLEEAIVHGAVKRLRPKVMTVATAFLGLMPILWSTGAGADLMKRVAAPMVGGLFTSFLMELLVYPAVYLLWRRRELPRGAAEESGTAWIPSAVPALEETQPALAMVARAD